MILELEEERRKDEALVEEILKCPEECFHKRIPMTMELRMIQILSR